MNEIKQRPILFSTQMVQAILEGRKTQTRRTVKPQPDSKATLFSYQPDKWPKKPWIAKFKFKEIEGAPYYEVTNDYKCPYGRTGDVLWVRERWLKYYLVDAHGYTDFDTPVIEYAADNPAPIHLHDGDGFQVYNKDGTEKMVAWKPSIHMPYSACRLFLRITDIRVERLQDITEEDAKAEGAQQMHIDDLGQTFANYRRGFQSLWESINGPESWTANPWTWCVSFERIDKPE